jgi:predicted regulator of Ras-like GTPase activity (Roadblock/LC7/MglB family)
MFGKILQRIVDETGGAVGAVLMGYDGIAIDQYFHPEQVIDLQMIAVEYANVLKEIRKTADMLNMGEMEEVSIRTEQLITVIRIVTSEYFVALALSRDGNFGKGRYLLTREAVNLRNALV